jgi:dihydrodipicolinate synthase/N-acetylneuraminate lyase
MQPVLARSSVFIPGHTLATGMVRGAHGAYSNVACLSPAGAQRWADECRANPAAGLRSEARIRGFWEANVAPLITTHGLPNMAADKAAAVAGGWLPGLSPRLRWPYRGATPEMITELARAARAELPEWFEA